MVNFLEKLITWWRNRDSQRTLGAKRDSRWRLVRAAYLVIHPCCEVCGGTEQLEVHHCLPFHIKPELELDPENLITLCSKPGRECHLRFGHLDSFRSYNPEVKRDAVLWCGKIKNRP